MVELGANDPCTIWVPEYDGDAPPCYHGKPLEIVLAMASAFSQEDHSPASAVRLLTEDLEVATGSRVEFPCGMPAHMRAAAVVALLLDAGLVREAAKA